MSDHTDLSDFDHQCALYWVTKHNLDLGYDAALEIAHELQPWLADYCCPPCITELTTAIHLGMSLREYLEFDSPRSWLDQQQECGDE